MACNCKKKRDIEAKYGEPIEETWFDKTYKYLAKILFFLMLLCLTIVLVPVVIVIAMYELAFSKNPSINLPKLIGKLVK